MQRTVLRYFWAYLATMLLCSCAQMTRHSNTLVFGTSTTVGVGIGNDATSTPSIEIGFRRQEVALVPLLANTSVTSHNNQSLLGPCPLPATIDNTNLEESLALLDACHFRATVGGNDRDSYSVIASFGTNTSATTDDGKVAIAQYFATGSAAQQLAQRGGANVIRAGGEAGEIARNTNSATASTQEIVSNNEADAIAARTSVRLWVRGLSPENPEGIDQEQSITRRDEVLSFIGGEFDADPSMGLNWLLMAKTEDLARIVENFEIPTYPEKTRQKLVEGIFEQELSIFAALRRARDETSNAVFACTSTNEGFSRAKQTIIDNQMHLDSDEIYTLSSGLPNEASSWSEVKQWLDRTSKENEGDRILVSQILVYYIFDAPFENLIERVCNADEAEAEDDEQLT